MDNKMDNEMVDKTIGKTVSKTVETASKADSFFIFQLTMSTALLRSSWNEGKVFLKTYLQNFKKMIQ